MIHSRRSNSYLSRTSRYGETATLVPPKVIELGHRLFTSCEQASLANWLQEPMWPRDTLNIYALEGYLTGLLVLPVELQPGAWLPPIWNLNGWKIPPPIDTEQRYAEFMELVFGYLRMIDRSLLETPPTFEPGLRLELGDDRLDVLARAQHWARGFGRALKQAARTRSGPLPGNRDAVLTIARYDAGQTRGAPDCALHPNTNLKQAILVLASNRISRGPLGALLKHRAPVKAPEL